MLRNAFPAWPATIGLAAALVVAASGCGDRSDDASYAGFSRDSGPEASRQEMLAAFERIRQAFYAGDAVQLCRGLSEADGRVRLGGSIPRCAKVVSYTIDAVESKEIRWPAHELVGVAAAERSGGITVANPTGQTNRMQFVKQDGEWRADITNTYKLEVLNARPER